MIKEGKLFGKISIIDILVIIVILVTAIGVYMKFTAVPETVQVKTEKFSYIVRIDKVRQYTVDGLYELGKIYDKETKEDLGEIVDVLSVENTVDTGINSRGEAVKTEYPDKYSVLIRIETNGNVGNNGYYTASNRLIGVGGDLSIESKYVSTSGRIVSIED